MRENIEFIIIVQCTLAKKRCSGYACMSSFYNRAGHFSLYPKNDKLKYISIECGGCCGKGVSSNLSHFSKKMNSTYEIKKENIAIHLSSCMVTDNYHYDRCPHIDYIKKIIIEKHRFGNLYEGTYLSLRAESKRENGFYNNY